MERYQAIIENQEYITHVRNIEKYEVDREFGHHDMSHFLDVARVGMLLNLTEDYNIPKDILYAAALLHDVGRDVQYEDGTPHEIASAEISEHILMSTDYNEDERSIILEAIASHRNDDIKDERNLKGLLYRADKLCRPCFFCKAEPECYWKRDKKNMELIW